LAGADVRISSGRHLKQQGILFVFRQRGDPAGEKILGRGCDL
jgi:hypothetical protein